MVSLKKGADMANTDLKNLVENSVWKPKGSLNYLWAKIQRSYIAPFLCRND